MKGHKSEASPLNIYLFKLNLKKRYRERMLEKYGVSAVVLI